MNDTNRTCRSRTRTLAFAVATVAASGAHAGINQFSGAGPDGGRVDRMVVDPADPNRIYAVGLNAGAFVSTDAGANWSLLDVDAPDISRSRISDVAVDPSSPGTVYVVDDGMEVGRSLDGGATWETFSDGIDQPLFYLRADPSTAGTVYAFRSGSLFKSTDSAESFVELTVSGLSIIDSLLVDPQDSQRVFVTGWEGVFRSLDGGASWSHLTSGLPLPNASGYIFAGAGAIDPQDSNVVYVNVSNEGVYKSTDGGDTWAVSNVNQPNDFFTQLMIDPSDSDRIYLASGNNDMVVSTNAGASWQVLPNVGLGDYTINDADFDPANPSRLYAASAKKGLFVSDDAGGSWSPISSGYVNTDVESLSVDAATGRIYAGVNGGTSTSSDGGLTWTPNGGNYDLASYALRSDELLPGHAWAGSSCCGLYETFDDGQTWARINLGLSVVASWVTDIDIPAGHPQTLLFTDYNRGLFASADRGQTWSTLTPALQGEFSGNVVLDSVAVHAADPSVIFVASPDFSSGGVLASIDGGATWQRKSGSGIGGPTRASAVAVHPEDPDTVFAGGTTSTLWKSTNGGTTWESVGTSTTGGVVDIYIDAQRPELMYYASASGNLYRSVDGGASFEEAQDDTGGERINSLAVDPSRTSRVLLGYDSIGYREYTFATELELDAVASTATPALGEPVTLTVTAANDGPLQAHSARVNLSVPASLDITQATASQGTCTIAAAGVDCELGALPGSTSATITVSLDALAAGSADIDLALNALEADSDDAGSTASVTLQTGGGIDSDGDGVGDDVDNCVLAANPAQVDADGDGYGNACDADLNNDCIVNPIDLGLFRNAFFGTDPNADLNGDGIVNPIDLGILRSLFFGVPGPSGVGGICD